MSDFDKEAEREKLRKRFGEDSQDETTERMSELLLRGATMTNMHCDNCGNPLFRKDGQEFCPNCNVVDERDGAEQTAANDQATTATEQTESPPQQTDTAQSQQPTQPTPSEQPSQVPVQPESQTETAVTSGGDLTAGRAALVKALTTHAQQGATTQDPHQAKAHLEAAREAAKALQTLQ